MLLAVQVWLLDGSTQEPSKVCRSSDTVKSRGYCSAGLAGLFFVESNFASATCAVLSLCKIVFAKKIPS